MKEIMETKQPMVNDCGGGMVVLFTSEEPVKQTERVQTGNETYEDREITRFQYDKTLIRVVPPVTTESVLEALRKRITERINEYDTSEAVNTFSLQKGDTKVNYWLNRETRNNLYHSVTVWKESGKGDYTLDLRVYGVSIAADCDTLLDMLDKLETYAVECFNVTSKHLNEVMQISDIETLLAYDYKSGYPEVLTLKL